MSKCFCTDAVVPRLESQTKGRKRNWKNSARSLGLCPTTCAHNQQALTITFAGCLQNWRSVLNLTSISAWSKSGCTLFLCISIDELQSIKLVPGVL